MHQNNLKFLQYPHIIDISTRNNFQGHHFFEFWLCRVYKCTWLVICIRKCPLLLKNHQNLSLKCTLKQKVLSNSLTWSRHLLFENEILFLSSCGRKKIQKHFGEATIWLCGGYRVNLIACNSKTNDCDIVWMCDKSAIVNDSVTNV